LNANLRRFAPLLIIIAGFAVVPLVTRMLGSGDLRTEMPDLRAAPQALPAVTVIDGAGRTATPADFRGRVVLLNFWATWCVPCRSEMPSLNALAARLPAKEFAVVPVSVDSNGAPAVRSYYAGLKLDRLPVYLDAQMDAMRTLGVVGIPTTLILDGDGREIGRLVGPAQWDAPAIVKGLLALASGGRL
jgi:thiol-disulfide isomerase/thioredoxin